MHIVCQIYIKKNVLLPNCEITDIGVCLCLSLGFYFSSPSESCISIEQCEHVVSELQDSMRKAIHLYRMVSDLRRGLCYSRLALQAASIELCACWLKMFS